MITPLSTAIFSTILLWAIYHLPIIAAGVLGRDGGGTSEDCSSSVLPSFSIIVPARDEGRVIKRCLDALLRLDYPRDRVEIIVVEGGSSDSTRWLCKEYALKHPNIRLLHQEAPEGKPAALNQALPHTAGDIIAVFDADSIPERDVLWRAAAHFRNPSVAAIQGIPLPINEEANILTKASSIERKAWFRGLLRGREVLGLFVPLTGSCQFIRRSILEEVGGWMEDSLAEDVEMAVQLLERGYRVRYAEDIHSWEENPTSLKQHLRQRTRWYRGYMEAALKYGRLLRRLNRRSIDAEVSLIGPYIMALSLTGYLAWLMSLTVGGGLPQTPTLNTLAFILTLTTLTSIGLALTQLEKPRRPRNLLWIPIIYIYWLIQATIAAYALLQIILRRPRRWEKTIKEGSTTQRWYTKHLVEGEGRG